ncbi:hypothetical protein EUGRSUZ_J00756 [Eucalyptus grandis]|uniref:Uncharacterized protein n=2 Tax=Eucalyptus grandis TaxID=71139 RepID=A0ACC3J4C8_EUCGR|nr:hypothetical protein EUGRSUZ_J00756 [Eucalyptus grandis]
MERSGFLIRLPRLRARLPHRSRAFSDFERAAAHVQTTRDFTRARKDRASRAADGPPTNGCLNEGRKRGIDSILSTTASLGFD